MTPKRPQNDPQTTPKRPPIGVAGAVHAKLSKSNSCVQKQEGAASRLPMYIRRRRGDVGGKLAENWRGMGLEVVRGGGANASGNGMWRAKEEKRLRWRFSEGTGDRAGARGRWHVQCVWLGGSAARRSVWTSRSCRARGKSVSRSMARPRCARDLMVPTGTSRAAAASW